MSDVTRLDTLCQIVGPFEPGTVALVGAGPGDSALVSVRGAVRLLQADVVLHDKLVGPELLALPAPEAERIFVGKWRGTHLWTQEQIEAELVRQARRGRRVVRLKGGDPFVFGRGGEECAYLAEAHVPFEVVPGITAAFGAPASAGIPLTHRGLSRSFALVTGHSGPDDLDQLDFPALSRMDTIAFYMGMKHLRTNCQRLIDAGLDPRTPAAVIRWGTRPEQRTIVGTVGDIADRVAGERVEPPAMILIGRVVLLRDRIEWFEKRPLHGQTVLVTRMGEQAASLAGPLLAAGAEVLVAPTIELAPVEDTAAVDEALRSLDEYDWLVLTSANGVRAMFERLDALGGDARWFAGVKIAAVGSATTAALAERGLRADLVPEEAVGEAMSEALIEQGVAGSSVLLLRADIARKDLPAALEGVGASCDDLPVYRTVCPRQLPDQVLERYDAGTIDWITLTSPSAFKSLCMLLGRERLPRLAHVRLASIGPVTTQAIRDAGYLETVEADPHDVNGLVAAIKAAQVRNKGV